MCGPEVQTSGWLGQSLLFPRCGPPATWLVSLLCYPPQVGTLAVEGTPALGSRGHRRALSHTLLLVLQVLGFEVDAVNSVQFSNHTGRISRWLSWGGWPVTWPWGSSCHSLRWGGGWIPEGSLCTGRTLTLLICTPTVLELPVGEKPLSSSASPSAKLAFMPPAVVGELNR